MSFTVLVIPEDPKLNGYILRPLVSAILEDAGKPQSEIKIYPNRRLTGYEQAKEAIRGEKLADKYGFFDLWIFMPDADVATPEAMEDLEANHAKKNLKAKLICHAAQPEIEIYACVSHRDKLGEHWQTVRSERDMKEKYFYPLVKKLGYEKFPGEGREQLTESSLTPRSALYQFCPDLAELRDRITQLFP